MKQPIQTLRLKSRANSVGRQQRAVLTVAGFIPVQFAVSIRRMAVSGSGWRFFSGKAPGPAGFSGRGLISTGRIRVWRFHEDSLAALADPTAAPHSRFVAVHGPGACGTVVPRCVRQSSFDCKGVAARRAGPRAQAGKRRTVSAAANCFADARIGSQPMVADHEQS